MTSQTDLDQGGTNRQWSRQYLGPSLGWINIPAPAASILAITAPGTYNIDPSTTLVTLNVNGACTLNLPKAGSPAVPAQLGLLVRNPITIVDVGGQAFVHPVTINPFGTDTVMGLASIQLAVNYGGYTLKPTDALNGWSSISP